MDNHNSSLDSVISGDAVMSPEDLVGVCVRVLVCLVGLVGNLLVLFLLPRQLKGKKDSFTLRLMLNLAVCDVLCMLTLPFWMLGMYYGWDALGLPACQAICYVAYVCLSASTLAVSLMSIHRYVQVLYRPQWERLGGRGEGLLLASIWLASCLSAIPSVSLYALLDDTPANSSQTLMVCEKAPVSEGQKVGVLLYETLIGFVFPLITLVTAYFRLQHKVSQKTRTVVEACGTSTQDAARSLRFLVTAIVATFFLVYLPYHVVNVMTIFTPLSHNPQKTFTRLSSDLQATLTPPLPYRSARTIVESVGFLNSCINPFLYAFAYVRLRNRKRSPSPAPTAGITRKDNSNTNEATA
ncbi:apelin receptor-like isoform X1 [Engraulis encrasicolus]|uniref:apelin receptor-like isoform X1 n=1 Tax=Engraulis encrasicolus TaxID=184585 RepID=UPI002FD09FE2